MGPATFLHPLAEKMILSAVHGTTLCPAAFLQDTRASVDTFDHFGVFGPCRFSRPLTYPHRDKANGGGGGSRIGIGCRPTKGLFFG